jgi:hypothetical protein
MIDTVPSFMIAIPMPPPLQAAASLLRRAPGLSAGLSRGNAAGHFPMYRRHQLLVK